MRQLPEVQAGERQSLEKSPTFGRRIASIPGSNGQRWATSCQL
jgi:hypothetical protein